MRAVLPITQIGGIAVRTRGGEAISNYVSPIGKMGEKSG